MERTIAPPLPNPHAPTAFTPPPLSCDAHCHVFGPAARFPFAPERTYTPPDAGVELFEDLQQRLQLSRAVFVQASCHGTDNQAMVDALIRGAGRYAGVAMVDRSFRDSDLGRLHDVGVRGIRFNFVSHLGGAPDEEEFWHLVKRVSPLGWHVVLHFDAIDLPQYAAWLERMPCPFIIDHMGRVPAKDGLEQAPFHALRTVMEDERAWVKISGAERLSTSGAPEYADVVPFAQALVEHTPDRILWGTDWPHPNVRRMPDDGDLVDLLAVVAPTPDIRQRILVTNPERLYDFN